MKYVIKGRWAIPSYVELANPAFCFTTDINKARHFDTIEDAIDALIDRQKDLDINKFYQSWDKHTIVGAEEIVVPSYREVAL